MAELIRNWHEGSHGPEAEVYFRLFEQYIRLYNWDGAEKEYAHACAVYLNSVNDEVVDQLCQASIRYCNDFLEAIGEVPRQFNQPRDVLALIYPSSLSIPNPDGRDEAVVHLELNCEWEEEHGMEWVVRGNKVLYVGAYNGENPWSDFEPKEAWNFA
jgi:hypothetical protein